MQEEKSFARQPLLYIQQPEIEKITANMQSDYFITEESTENHPIIQQKEPIVNEKQFDNKTIKEKINYIMNTSEHIPRLKCLIYTKERTYRGTMTRFEDEEVCFQPLGSNHEKALPIERITNLKIISF